MFKFRTLGVMALVACGAFLVQADDKEKGANLSPPADAAKVTAKPTVDKVKNLYLAYNMIQYGRAKKSPESLVIAARLMAEVDASELKETPTREKDKDAPKVEEKKDKTVHKNDIESLLAEAKKMSNNAPEIVRLANAIEMPRGAVGGPKRKADRVEAYSTDTYTISFEGGEVARVAISGDGDTRLDLYVYDGNGNLITSRVGPGDDALATWVPKWTGKFTIKVVNRGSVYNNYVIATN